MHGTRPTSAVPSQALALFRVYMVRSAPTPRSQPVACRTHLTAVRLHVNCLLTAAATKGCFSRCSCRQGRGAQASVCRRATGCVAAHSATQKIVQLQTIVWKLTRALRGGLGCQETAPDRAFRPPSAHPCYRAKHRAVVSAENAKLGCK